MRWSLPLAMFASSFAALLAIAAEVGFSRVVTPGLIARYESQFDSGAAGRLMGWQDFVRRTTPASAPPGRRIDAAFLDPVNQFFNRVPSFTDQEHWNADDYWATPAETLASNGADCEDYAIAKYFTLKELGVPVARLRMVYVRTRSVDGAHMVLAYYAAPGADPLILDNLDAGIRPAADRPDLQPVYSFNDEDLQLAYANAPSMKINPAGNRKWAGLLGKLQRELTY